MSKKIKGFWRDRRVLITGQTGFKGCWLMLWLEALGAKVSAFALPPESRPNLYELTGPWTNHDHAVVDLRNFSAVRAEIERCRPEIIFHLAAQALVRASYRHPVETYATNLLGTVHLLEAVRAVPEVAVLVAVTTDKVYENASRGVPFLETDRLGGKDPYSNSKACAELAIQCYRDSFLSGGRGPALAAARAGNVIGGGDWSEDRLVPDFVRALIAGRPVSLRYPCSVRPWQHVLEPLSGYLMLAERLATDASLVPTAVNFGPDPRNFMTVAEVAEKLGQVFGNGLGWKQAPGDHPPEAATLTLESSLAEHSLGWRPRLSREQTINWTAEWYRAWRNGGDARRLALEQIEYYSDL